MADLELLKQAKEALDKAVDDQKRHRSFIASLGSSIVDLLRPILDKISDNAKISKDEINSAIGNIKVTVNPEFKVPEIKIPEIKVPTPVVNYTAPKIDIPTIKIPEIKVPKITIPEIKVPAPIVNLTVPEIKIPKFDAQSLIMPKDMSVYLKGITQDNPLPVFMMNPSQGGSSPRSGLTLSDIVTPSGTSIIDSVNNALRVNIAVGSLTLGYDTNSGPAGTNTLRVVQAVDVAVSAKTIGVAMTTNPTAASDGTDTYLRADKLGRAIHTPVQVRQLRNTAYVSLTTGTETTLFSSSAGTFNDLIYVMGANTSTAAVQVDVRAVSGGNIVITLEIPANASAGVALPVPWPQDATGNSWTVDMPDITGTTVGISALFSQET